MITLREIGRFEREQHRHFKDCVDGRRRSLLQNWSILTGDISAGNSARHRFDYTQKPYPVKSPHTEVFNRHTSRQMVTMPYRKENYHAQTDSVLHYFTRRDFRNDIVGHRVFHLECTGDVISLSADARLSYMRQN